MGFEDVFLPAGLFNLVTVLVALAVWLWAKPSGRAAQWAVLVVLAGTAFHLVTDVVADLGEVGEHMLMHGIALAVVGAIALGAMQDAKS